MDSLLLKELLIDELARKVPAEKISDKSKLREFVLANIDKPLVDKLVAEFCGKNPEDFAVLNVFSFNDAEQNTDETQESIKYKLAINRAGLNYRKKEIDSAFNKLDTLVKGC
ncbi:hypothetical protein LQZ19_06290 [Treponema primitia]|uniref:hypothetical protein n=1 Tax=Treponema primitia TaxID=88058 RepID=UPI00397F9F1F